MKPAYEERYLAIEETQWWCKARREMVLQLIRQSTPSVESRVLEIGCSGGVLLQQLAGSGYANVYGIDISEAAVNAAHARGLENVSVFDASTLPFPDESFDLVVASDVLEHIEKAIGALRDWRRVLAPAGKLIVFVPAFRFLWSSHDEANRHFRRYSGRQLRAELAQAGFKVERLSYWNALLTLPGIALKMGEKLAGRSSRETDTGGLVQPPAPFNWLLHGVISVENAILRYANLPFGTSVFAVATIDRASSRTRE